MKNTFSHFFGFSAFLSAVLGCGFAVADQAPNPRSTVVFNATSGRSDSNVVKRGSDSNANVVSKAARSTVRRPTAVVSRNATNAGQKKTARNAQNVRTATPAIIRNATISRSAKSANVSRAATMSPDSARARNAVNAVNGLTRAASKARATAVFSDISKIGGGYAACRDSYATCMDQFCANANDTYRRCYCSSRFTDFRDMENAMDQAKVLLQRFEDNNLNAVDKTADEVKAMYSATVGEAAIKNDTSAAQNILNEIGDLLSGKKKAQPQNNNSSTSLGTISLDFSTDMGDIWGGDNVFSDSGTSMFDTSSAVDMTTLEGQQLYNASNKQCAQVIQSNCENSAVLNMATSAYNIMISQDCNMYEKNLNKKREQVLQTVRQAEKILRDARLEEFRAHNSRDVNECISKVQTAITAETACGANYKRCLDYSGVYINQSTGEPIYTQRLFQLADIITLSGAGNGGSDVLGQNKEFDKFLDQYKNRAEAALDSCRTIADTVWTEFKRMALIEIAQAQDAKIEEVKMSCVKTMADCYDTQSNSLKSFDNTTAKTSGAISAYAAKSMCEEKVMACASLYGNTDGCKFDGNGKITAGNASDGSNRCGLTALLAFVDNVDEVRIAEGCDEAIDSHLSDLCGATADDSKKDAEAYPWKCRLLTYDDLALNLYKFAFNSCKDPNLDNGKVQTVQSGLNNAKKADEAKNVIVEQNALPLNTLTKIDSAIEEVRQQLDSMLGEKCGELEGYWVPRGNDFTGNVLTGFYNTVYGVGGSSAANTTWGKCVENTTRVLCESYNSNVMESVAVDNADDSNENSSSSVTAKAAVQPVVKYATYDVAKDECVFTPEWYQRQCSLLGEETKYENGVCYVSQ